MLEFFIENPNLTSIELSELIGVTKRTIEGTLNVLQKKAVIERIGSKRDGNWIVIK
ncbi:MarR family transcriptional regulator [Streptobacillus moniliformis]|uniref:MarR family transcriptional regulator n=1 Tax=Streptobacillus moniliformis TaxID=34105 RepID=UPI001D02B755|nr:helix-turn-helix domain-containing protein [Streptobacillus moniliformis]